MKNYFLIYLILISLTTSAQFDKKAKATADSSTFIPMITISYARQWPGSDLDDRFGANNNTGGSFAIKTKTNWYFGIKGNFLWGNRVDESSILDNITTDNNFLITDQGKLTEVFLQQRGTSFFVFGGRVFNIQNSNKNSGILVYGGLGTLHHKISFDFQDEVVALSDELQKGYDRLSFGYAINTFIGYTHFSKNRLINFYGGFDFTMGKTKSLRKFNFDTQLPDNESRSDILYGIRLGWIIRFNKREAENFYFN